MPPFFQVGGEDQQMNGKLFSFDIGTNSIGWCVLSLNDGNDPTNICDAGVRIYSDGREPKSGSSLAEGRA